METTEKIVEAYARYVRGWATLPNVKCDGQLEIDLMAVDPRTGERFHIESGVSVSESYSKLTAKPFIPEDRKTRGKVAGARRTVGHFIEHKFGAPEIIRKLSEYGFEPGHYGRIIATWSWTDEAKSQADNAGIELWDFRQIMAEIAEAIEHQRTYFTDDTLRTINLFVRALKDTGQKPSAHRKETKDLPPTVGAPFWVYQNKIRRRARLHRSDCRHCNGGIGIHGVSNEDVNEWLPFEKADAARSYLIGLGYDDAADCLTCM